MTKPISHEHADRTQLQQIIAGLDDGVIIIDPGQSIAWANKAAFKMHGVAALTDLGSTVDQYRQRFELRYRNKHTVAEGSYPIDRVIAGEAFDEVVVEVGMPGDAAIHEFARRQRIPQAVLTGNIPDRLRIDSSNSVRRARTFGVSPPWCARFPPGRAGPARRRRVRIPADRNQPTTLGFMRCRIEMTSRTRRRSLNPGSVLSAATKPRSRAASRRKA